MHNYTFKRLKYIIFAKHKKGFSIHSPFVFDFITKVIENKNLDGDYLNINTLRKQLKKNNSKISTETLGAKSKTSSSEFRKISSIYKSSSVQKKYGELLYRICNWAKPQCIIETGTCMGISTAYLALSTPEAHTTSIEGNSDLVKIASKNLTELNIANTSIIEANIDDVLEDILKKVKKPDFVFLDANHTYIACKKYFEQILDYIHNDTIVVIDDIHWSTGMEKAWNEIKQNTKVTVSIDLFQFGIIFFRKESPKQDFKIKF